MGLDSWGHMYVEGQSNLGRESHKTSFLALAETGSSHEKARVGKKARVWSRLRLSRSRLKQWGSKDPSSTEPAFEKATNWPFSQWNPSETLFALHRFQLQPILYQLFLEPMGRNYLISLGRGIFILLLVALILFRLCCTGKILEEEEPPKKQFCESADNQAESSHILAEAPCADITDLSEPEYLDMTFAPPVVKKAFSKGDRVFVEGIVGTIVYGPDIDGEYMAMFDEGNRQSRFLKAHLIEKASLLQLQPKAAIRFSCNGPSSLTLTNVSAGHVAFRVQMSAPRKYILCPARATLRPQERLEVQITPKHGRASNLHGFLVMAAPVNSDAEVTIEEWQEIPADVIEQYTLSVTVSDDGASSVAEEEAPEFKVGDHVRSIMELGCPGSPDKVGEIIEVDESSEQPYRIRFDDGYGKWYKEHWIEAVEDEHSHESSSNRAGEASRRLSPSSKALGGGFTERLFVASFDSPSQRQHEEWMKEALADLPTEGLTPMSTSEQVPLQLPTLLAAIEQGANQNAQLEVSDSLEGATQACPEQVLLEFAENKEAASQVLHAPIQEQIQSDCGFLEQAATSQSAETADEEASPVAAKNAAKNAQSIIANLLQQDANEADPDPLPINSHEVAEHASENEDVQRSSSPTLESVWVGLASLDQSMEAIK